MCDLPNAEAGNTPIELFVAGTVSYVDTFAPRLSRAIVAEVAKGH